MLMIFEGLLPSMQRDPEEEKVSKKPISVVRSRLANNNEESDDDTPDEVRDVTTGEIVDKNKTSHEQIFIFALMWSLGAFLEDHDRHRLGNLNIHV